LTGRVAFAAAGTHAVHARVGHTAYARVDLVDGDDGRPIVMEVELVEPSLFLDLAPGAAERLADTLRARLREPHPAPPPAARRGTG
jgi:hypothetical protein